MASVHRRVLKDLGFIFKARHTWIKRPISRGISIAATCCQKNALYSAVCVQRLPVITPALNDIENRFSDLLSKIEDENSYLSDFEIRLISEAHIAQKSKDADEDDRAGDAETALDLQDKWDAEIKEFVPAPTETEADKTNNLRTVDRKLDSSLYLLVKQNIEGKDHWVLPQTVWVEGETLRQTAERALSTLCGEVKTTFLGNAPCAVAKFDPVQKVHDRKIKLFFFQAWYRGGEITPNQTEAKDYLWVTRGELSHYCHSSYREHLKKFIFDV